MILAFPVAFAGYGDPEDGYPSHAEREVVLWTNAARVAPDAFTADYRSGGCSTRDFSRDELTAKEPLYVDTALTEAARYHSDDMRTNGCFQHESCDGTDTWSRIGRYYTESTWLGENIAYGYGTARSTVLSGWMCSESGHRANIMSGDYDEIGAGVAGDYMTQDFAGQGRLPEGEPPVRMAVDVDGVVYADWSDANRPVALTLVQEDGSAELALEWGEADNGVYSVEIDGDDCSPWHVEWETKGGDAGRFPEGGSWLYGDCDEDWEATAEEEDGGGDFDANPFDDEGAGDTGDDARRPRDSGDVDVVGCTSSGARPAGWAVLALAAALAGRVRGPRVPAPPPRAPAR
jgi:hypothetical protein